MDRDRIVELAELGVAQSTIARTLRLPRSTVQSICLSAGVGSDKYSKSGKERKTSYRGSVKVKPFSDEEDLVLLDLESMGLSKGEIARRMKRNRSSIINRLRTLARKEAMAEVRKGIA